MDCLLVERNPHIFQSSGNHVFISQQEEKKTKMLYIPPQTWPLFSLSKTMRMAKIRIAFNQSFLPNRIEKKKKLHELVKAEIEVQASTVTKFNFSSLIV